MREFRVISPSVAQSQPSTLKAQDFEAFGEPFVPEFLYEVIRSMQSFAHMKVIFTQTHHFLRC
jgi:ubiquitin carboxyl-terminal hydrolase 10